MADVEFELRCDPSSLERKTWDSAALAADQTSKHALVFAIAEQNFAIAADFIEQIVELPGITRVPTAGSTLLGLADQSGKPIPVVDIAPLLGLDSVLDGFRHGLLLNHKGLRVMLAIESVVVLRELAKEQNTEVPSDYQATEFAEYACELTHVDDYTSQLVAGAASQDNGPDAQSGNSTVKRVVVLNVPQLLMAVANAATIKPATAGPAS